MPIDSKNRKKLVDLLDGVNYRKIVSDRTGCHPNTVTNVLMHGNDNPVVELELLTLAQEQKAKKETEDAIRRKNREIIKQL